MEAEAKVPEDSSATNFTLVESTTTIERQEIKFTKKNGNDLNSKYPLVEETRQANSGRTSEISVTGPQEIYQHSSKVSAESEKHAEHQPEGYNIEVLKHSNADVVVMGIIPKSSVPEDKALSTSPNTASVQAGTVVGSIQDQIQNEAKLAVTDEQQEPEKYFAEKEEVPEAFDLHEVTGKIYAENEKKDEPQFEAQSLETKVIKNPNLEGVTPEINSSNDTKEHEKVSASQVGEILNIKDGGKFITEEAKVVEEATNMKLLKTATEALEGDDNIDSEAPIPSTLAIAKGETVDEIFQKQTLKEEESATIENYESCRPESELEQAAKAVEAIDPSETMCKLRGENEEHTDHQSETPTLESVITKNTVFKGFMAIESSTKPNYHVEEPEKIPDSHTTEISEIKDGGKTLLEETIYIKEPMDVKLQISETKSVPEDKVAPALLTTALYTAETVEESIQEEIHKEVESAVTDSKEEQTPENDFEEKNKEATNYVFFEEPEKIPDSHTTEISEIKDGGKTLLEETIYIKEPMDVKLQIFETKSVPEDKVAPDLLTTASYTAETVEESIQEEIHKAVESAVTDSKEEQTPENDFEENNNEATNYVFSEEPEKILDSHTTEISEIKDGGKTVLEETIYIKEPMDVKLQISETKSVPEDKVAPALLTTLSYTAETVEESIQEEIHKEVESAGTDSKEEQTPENDFEEKNNEAFDLQQVTAENEKKDKPQPETHSPETIVIKHQNLDGVATETNPSNDTEVFEMVPASHTEEKLEINEDDTFVIEKAKDIKEATDMQITESATESVLDDGAQSTLHKLPTVKGEKVNEIFQEHTLEEEESAAIVNSDSCTPENQLTQAAKFVEQIGLSDTMVKVAAVNEQHADNQFESPILESAIKEHTLSEGLVTMESSNKSSYDVEELQKIPGSHFVENSENKDVGKPTLEETIYIKEATDVELGNTDRESVPTDEASTPLHITEAVGVGTVDGIFEEEIQMKVESVATDTKQGQIPDNAFKIKEFPKAINLSAATGNTFAETKKKDQPQHEVLNQKTIVINHPTLGETTETNTRNDMEEIETITPLITEQKIEINDGGKCIEEQAKDMEEATVIQQLKTATESVSGNEAPSTLLKSAIVKSETHDEIIEEQTLKEEEMTVIETQKSCKEENEQEQVATNVEAIDLPITMGKVNAENEEECHHQSEATAWQSAITKHTLSEGVARMDISTMSSHDVEEQEKIPKSHTAENSEIKDSGKAPPEEAMEVELQNAEEESVPKDKAVSTLSFTASVGGETVEESIQEEIQKEGESKVADAKDIKEGLRPENDFEKNKNVLEDFELLEATAENEKKDEPQLEVQSLQTTDISHPNLQGEATETSPSNDSEEHEKVSTSCTRDNLGTKEGGKYTHEEAKEMKKATDIQLLKTATESFDDEGPSILATLSIVKDETVKETFCLQMLKDEEPAAADNTGSCPPENDLEQTAEVVEDIEEHADDKSQASKLENAITKHTNSEGMMTSEGSTKTSNEDEEQEKIPKSHSVESLEIKESSKILPEQTISMKEAALESTKSETKSLTKDKVLSTLPIAAPIGVETVEERIQEDIHKEVESPVTNTKEGQTPKDNFEEIKEVPEAFELHEAKGNIPQSEAQSQQTIVIKHQDVGDTTKTNTCNDTEENEQLPASHTSKKLEIKDVKKFIEAQKETEEAIDMQLQESSKGMAGDDEAPSTLPTAAMVKGEMVDKVFQEQTFTKEEPAAVDKHGSIGHENELEETATLVEAINLPETKGKVGAENEEQGDNQSKVPSQEAMITNHTNSEGTVTMEGSTESYDVEQQKIPDSHSVQYLEIKHGVMTVPEQAIYIKEATNVELPKSETESLPEDKAMSTLSSTTSVEVEMVEESIQEELHSEVESAVTETKAGQRPESDFVEEKNVPEDLDLHKTGNTGVEAQKKYDPQHEVQSLETIAIEHPDSEADATEINTSNDTQEHEEIPASHTSEKLEIKERGKLILVEGKEKEEGIDIQFEELEKESVPDDEASSTLPTSAMVKDDTADEIIQKQTFKKEDSAVVNTNGSFRQENELDETAKVVEAIDIPKTMGKANEENERHVDYQSEFPILETLNTQHANSEGIVTVERSTKASYDVDEQENIRESHSVEKSDVTDGGKTLPEEAIYSKEATYVELPKSETESVPEDKVLSALPTAASFKIETVEEGNQEEIQKEGGSAVIDTKEGRRPENDFEEKKKVHEAFDLHEATGKTCVETEKKYEPQSEAQSSETIAVEHPDLEGDAKETNPSNDTEEFVQVPVSHTAEELVVKDREKFILEESKEKELSTGKQLQESAKESVPDDEALSTLPTLEIVKADTVKEIIQEQTFEEEKSATIHYELEQMTTDVEVNDLPKTTGKGGAQNEEYMTKHTILEGLERIEISTKSNYVVEKTQKIPESHPVDSSQIKDGGKTEPEEVTYINNATDVELKSETESVPEDKTLSTLPTTAFVEVETSEESIQTEIYTQVDSAITETEEGQQLEIDSDERNKFSEALHQHEATLENKKIDELQFEVQRQETIVIENPDLEGEIKETNPSNDIEELEQVTASHTEEKSAAIDNDGSFRPENELEKMAKVIEATDLPETIGKVADENKEPADHQSEVCTLKTAIKKHIISEGLGMTEIIPESSYDVEQPENIPESHNVDNSEIKDGQKTMLEEAIYVKEATNLESPNTETKSQPEDNTLPTIATVGIETTEESSLEEIHKDAKPAVTATGDGQRRANDFDETKEVHKVYLQEETFKNERMHEHQPEVQSLETIVTEHPDLDGGTIKTNKINDPEELEQFPTSYTEKNLEIKDGAKFIEKEVTETEEAMSVQLPESEKENVPDDRAPSTLPASSIVKCRLAIVKDETAEQFFQEQTPKIEKSESIDKDGSGRPENEFKQTVRVVEAIDLPETTSKVNAENKEHADHQSKALTSETAISKHTIGQELETMEISTESSHNVEEPEKNPELHRTASIGVESIEQSIQEKIHTEAESAVPDTKERQRPENDFKETKTVVEDFDLCEATGEYEKKDESQSEAQSTETIVIKHPNVGGTPETKPSNDVEELEQVPMSHNTEKLEIREGGKYTQEEAEKVEEATDMQLAQSAKESVPDDEALSTLAKSEIFKCETADEIVHKQTFTEEKLVAIDNQWTCRPENALEQEAKVVEEINLAETMIKVGDENDKHGNHQPEARTLETLVTKHKISEGLQTMESHTKSSYNVEELEKIPESQSVENSKIDDGGITVPVEAIYINEATAVELTKSTTESMPEDKVLSTLPTTTLVGVETIEESIQQEVNKEAELTVTDIHAKQRTENDFEEKKTVPKDSDLQRASAENEKKDEPQFEVQSLETIIIKHATLEGDTTDTKPSDDTEEHEQVPVSYTVEKSEIQDAAKSILEEEKEMEEANDIQLQESAKESIPDNEAPSTLPTSAIVKVEMLEEMFQEQTIEEEESEAIDNGRSRPENEFEQAAKVVEVIDLHETMGKVSVENAEHANHQSKTPTMETTFRRHTTSEGLVTKASSTGLSYEVDELRKIPGLHSLKNSEIKDCGETLTEERTDVESSKCETESVPEDKSQSTLPTTAPVGAETVQESIQENIHMEVKSAMAHTKEWQRPDNGLKEKKKVPEAFDQDQVTSNTSAENEKKDEPQSEVQSAHTTTAKTPNSDTEELEIVPVSHTRAKIEINDGGKFMQEEEKEMEEATYTQLPISTKQSVRNEEAPSTLSTLAIVKVESEIVEEISQEQTLEEQESAVTDNNGSCRPKNKLEQTETVFKEIDLPETMDKVNAENEKYTHHQSEAPTLGIVITKYRNSEGIVTMDSSTKSNYEVKQQEKNPEAHSADNLENKDGGRTSPVEAIYIKEATNVELAELEIESVLEHKSLSTLLTIEAVRVEQIDESTPIKIQKVAESAVIDTNEKHRPENDLEEEKKVPQAFDLHGVAGNTCTEKKRKDEPQSEVQSLETIIVKHPNVEGKTTDKNPNNDTKELEDIPSSSTREKLEMNDGGKFIQEEAKENKEATGVPDKEALPTMLRSATVKVGTVDEIFEDQTLKEEESTMIDNGKSCRPENEIEQTAKVVEEINPIETIGKVIAQSEEHADFQPEAPTLENVVSKHTISAGMLTTERSTESSYDVKKLEKLPESHTVEILEIKDDVNFPPEEALYIKEATNVELHKSEAESVPEDEALSTTNTASVRVKTVTECIEEEMHEEAESAVTDNKEGQKQENNFEEKEKVPEAFYLHEETGNTSAENEKNAEPQSDAHRVETMLTKLQNFEGIETENISPSINSAELEKFSASHIREESKIAEETDMQLPKSKIETLDACEQSNMHESANMAKSGLPAEIPEPPYPSEKVESYSDYEAHDLIKEHLPQTEEKSNNIQDQISEYDDDFQGQKFQCENQVSPEPQLEAKHHFNVPLNAKETSASSLITKEVHGGVDTAGGNENIEEQTINSHNILVEAQTSSPGEGTVNQVEDEISEKLKASGSNEEQKAITITCLSIESDPTKKESARRDSDEVIDSAKEDEFEKISPSAGDGTAVVIKGSRDTEVKEAPQKKSHGILSSVGSKVKRSISKVKRAITGKSPHTKTQSPK